MAGRVSERSLTFQKLSLPSDTLWALDRNVYNSSLGLHHAEMPALTCSPKTGADKWLAFLGGKRSGEEASVPACVMTEMKHLLREEYCDR